MKGYLKKVIYDWIDINVMNFEKNARSKLDFKFLVTKVW